MDEKGKKLVKLKDFHNTIIVIDENADTDQSVKKYMKDLRDYKHTAVKDLTKDKNKNFND